MLDTILNEEKMTDLVGRSLNGQSIKIQMVADELGQEVCFHRLLPFLTELVKLRGM